MSREILAYEETFQCVQCGYCLPVCPTYITMEKETHSPRGRINLVKMVAEGKLSLDEISNSLELCLGCRACETACPTNVPYGEILQSAKEALAKDKRKSRFGNFFMKEALSNKKMMRAAGMGIQVAQKAGLTKMAKQTGMMRVLPENLRAFEEVAPNIQVPKKKNRKYTVFPANGTCHYRIGFFVGCMMDVMFAKINDLSMKLLQLSGCEVTLIEEQTCCGALQHHAGETEIAKGLAQKNIEVFEKHSFDYVVNSIGGCGAMLVEYPHLFEKNSEWYERAARFSKSCADISVLLAKLQLPIVKEMKKVVTYQPSCHLRNVQKVINEPVELLHQVKGITYVPHKQMDMCCGSAGVYNIVHFEESMEILGKKMEHVNEVEPDIIVTTNPGCHLQMKLGVKRSGNNKKTEVMHLVELLAVACDIQ